MSVPSISRLAFRLPEAARGYAVLVGGELVSKVLAAITFAYLARALGAAAYGQLELALAIVMVLTLVVDCGFGAYGAREIARDEAVTPRLVTDIVGLRFGFAVLAVAALAALALLIDKPWGARLLLALYAVPLLLAPGHLAFVFQGRRQMHLVALANAARWLLFAVGMLLAVRSPDDLHRAPLVEAAAIGAAVGLSVIWLVRSGTCPSSTLDTGTIRLALRESLPIGASGLVWAARIFLPTMLLGLQVGDAAAGWFGAAHRLAVALHTFVWLYYFNVLPSLARASLAPIAELRRLIGTSLRLTAWGAVALGVVGGSFAGPAISLVYGPGYDESVAAFSMLTWFVAIALLSGNYRYALVAFGEQRRELVAAIGGLVIAGVTCVLLIPTSGLHGAAVSLVLSELLIFGLAVVFVHRRVTRIPLWRYVWRPLVAGAALTVVAQVVAPAGVWAAGALLSLALAVAASTDRGLVDAVRSIVVRRM